jgi:hypothetical protein
MFEFGGSRIKDPMDLYIHLVMVNAVCRLVTLTLLEVPRYPKEHQGAVVDSPGLTKALRGVRRDLCAYVCVKIFNSDGVVA